MRGAGRRVLRKYGHDGDYNWYFFLTREWPAADPALQHLLLHVSRDGSRPCGDTATVNDEYARIAREDLRPHLLEKSGDPKCAEQHVPAPASAEGLRPLPMRSFCNTAASRSSRWIDKELLEETISICLHEVMRPYTASWDSSTENVEPSRLHEPAVGLPAGGAPLRDRYTEYTKRTKKR